jgi:putative FmdB family regulatory protein
MALYDFRCTVCGLEFEVSRPMAQAAEPAHCPVDGA